MLTNTLDSFWSSYEISGAPVFGIKDTTVLA